MDTYRVQLPHPQAVENEEEFITNSGRSVKRPVVDENTNKEDSKLKLPGPNDEDLIGSGVSVLSPHEENKEGSQDGQLSDSIQAELHLSLDRLSENFDPEELKKLQEKSQNSRTTVLMSERKRLESLESGRNQPIEKRVALLEKKEPSSLSQDSLDAEILRNPPLPLDIDTETSEEFIVSGEEDDHTIVADSLNYQSFGEGVTVASSAHSTKRSESSSKTPMNMPSSSIGIDHYANLRYNPNWRKEQLVRDVQQQDQNDASSPSKLDDSLNEEQSMKSAGGAIVIHRKGLYSPAGSDWKQGNLPSFGSRSISPTRLSADPSKLLQTNAQYEDEFNKMLRAEILNKSGNQHVTNENSFPQKQVDRESGPLKKEGYPVLIRKLEQDRKSTADEPARIGGYQLLPDRHRIPSPSRGQNSQETPTKKQHRTPKMILTPRNFHAAEDHLYIGKKDPLIALSPREQKRVMIAPTPPKMPKPKDVDYIELNKQRLGRKSNSAGYLDLHKKRSRKVEAMQTRSHSELNSPVTQAPMRQYPERVPLDQEQNFTPGSVEDLWARQAERLKFVKAQNLNRGKVKRSPRKWMVNNMQGAGLPNPNYQPWEGRTGENDSEWSYDQHPSEAGFLQQNSGNVQVRQPLPIPSQGVQYSSGNFKRLPHQGDNSGSYQDFNYKRAYYSPRIQPLQDQTSPIMKAFHSKYVEDVYEPNVINSDRGHELRQNFDGLPDHSEVWMNPDNEQDLPPSGYILQGDNHSSSKASRKVTFLGDNESIAIDGLGGEIPYSTTSATGPAYGFGRYKVPLPPTPPSKSQRHSVQRGREGKENDDRYYEVREESYSILPPILKSNSKKSPLQPASNGEQTQSPASENMRNYLEQQNNPKKKFQYKIYTLNDYKNLKKDVKLGGLGPDLGSVRDKTEKVDRARKYAEIIRKEHMTKAVIKPRDDSADVNGVYEPVLNEKHHFSATMDEKLRREMFEKRTRAIEYSKRIPKPKVKAEISPSPRMNDSNTPSSNYSSHLITSDSPNSHGQIDLNFGMLEMLKERHEKEKARVAAFTGSS